MSGRQPLSASQALHQEAKIIDLIHRAVENYRKDKGTASIL